jgi:hypothetical protein
LCVIAGLALGAAAVGSWGMHAFGRLNPQESLRIVIPSATLLMLGLQIVFSSGLLGVLQLDTRPTYARTRMTDLSKSDQAGEVMSVPDSVTR